MDRTGNRNQHAGIPALGEATVDWDTLASVCERLKRHHRLRSALGISTSDVAFLYRRFVEPDENTHHANRFNFMYELQRARHLSFSDDRDRVFAFLGHYSVRSLHPSAAGPCRSRPTTRRRSGSRTSMLRCKYCAKTQLQPVLYWQQYNTPAPASLPVESRQTRTWRHGSRTNASCPPGCPTGDGLRALYWQSQSARTAPTGDSIAKIEILDDLVLRVHGVEIDTIEACSRRLVSEDFYGKKRPDQLVTTMIEQLWHELCQKERFNLDDIYRNGQTAFFAFMQTFSNGCVQAAGHQCVPYHKVPDSVWLRKAARYIVETLGASDDVSEEVHRAAEVTEPEGDHETWCRWATSASDGRVFARTRRGYYVLGPAALEPGDVACVMFGSKVPFCFRPMGKRHLLVGECYVHGLMKGEAMDMLAQNKLHEKVFDIV